MKLVLLDTVGLIALWDQSDQWHPSARAAITLLNKPGTRLVTTSLVLLECGNAAARKPYRADVCTLRDQLASQGNLFEPSIAEVEDAWAHYRSGWAGSASIVDHVSFAIMRRLGIMDAFTNDGHFKAAGFNTLF